MFPLGQCENERRNERSEFNGELVAMNARLYTGGLKILRRVSFIYIYLSLPFVNIDIFSSYTML